MSKYEWERGEVKIPAKEFSILKKNLISSIQSRHDSLFNKATKIFETIKMEKKGKRNFPIKERINEILNPRSTSSCGWRTSSPEYNYDEQNQIIESLLKDNKLVKPKKKDFALESKDVFTSEELTVRLDSKNKILYWDVADNNHSVDEAHNSFLGKTTIRLLERVNYTNRTGGYFEGNDEYNRDEGNGANYTTLRFGKFASEKMIRKEMRLRTQLSGLRGF